MAIPKKITRNREKYVYHGEIPNRHVVKEATLNYANEQGRKAVFVEVPDEPGTLVVYVSSKFYKTMVKTLYPAYGTKAL